MQNSAAKTTIKSWKETLLPFERPVMHKSLLQLLNSAIPFFVIWLLMLASLHISYALTLLLAIPAAGFLVRLFIIQHDCGHGSFFSSTKANDFLGGLIGLLTLTPYKYWRKIHAIHHATTGDLDQRGFGDVTTLTVREYLQLPWRKRCAYRLYRNPIVLFGLGPIYQFFLKNRLPLDLPLSWKREWLSVMRTNLGILLLVVLIAWAVGWERLLWIQLPISIIAGVIGVWLFYMNHQFEDTHWERRGNWDFQAAAIKGSSFYDLPSVLNWFTGNIGVHHIHHLSSKIPNYFLRSCLKEIPQDWRARRLTLKQSIKCARLKLWDEKKRKLVGFPGKGE